jgi:hypothetical protein
MKIGAENKTMLYVMVGLMAIAIVLVLRSFVFVGGSSSPAVASATEPATAPAAARNPRTQKTPAQTLDPTLRTDLLKNSEGAEYKGTGRNIFEAQAEPAPIEKKPEVAKNTPPPGPPPPPPPPPIPLKFYGFANKPGQPKSIFLADGEDIFIGHEGEIVNRRYRIVHIGANSVEIEDVMNNNRQSIPLTQG